MKLTPAEEQLMKYLWELERAYMKDLRDAHPDPKPRPTTLATLLKRMNAKGFVGYDQHGSNREYYPLVGKETYFASRISSVVKDFFNDSASQFASFFTRESDMSLEELETLKKEIEERINNQE